MSNIIVIDTETTGLPKTKGFNNYHDPKYSQYYDSSRLIEIGYIIFNNKGEKIKSNSFLIKPNKFLIKNTFIHGITHKDAVTNGIELNEGLNILNEDLNNIKTIVAHNILFDINIILSEAYRCNNNTLIDNIKDKELECSMKLGKDVLKLSRFPKLTLLYKTLFNKEVVQDHRALSDCILCSECYFKLKNE